MDPAFWDGIMGYITAAGTVTYEKDWLNILYKVSPEQTAKPWVGDAVMDHMARVAKEKGLTLQYCMPLPRDFLQSVRCDNLTTTRTANDRFDRKKWDNFMHTARMASALGIYPWTDVFLSSETENLLIATLSTGMMGLGDEIGKESKGNLMRAARTDGMRVKSDVPLVSMDDVNLADSAGKEAPMVAWTYAEQIGMIELLNYLWHDFEL